MANPSGRKGRDHENHVRDTYLRPLWPEADRMRLRGKNDYGDFINVPWLVEAKWRAKLAGTLWGWVMTAWNKVRWNETHWGLPPNTMPFAIVMAMDKRKEPYTDIAIIPAWHYFDLLNRLTEEQLKELEDEQYPRPY